MSSGEISSYLSKFKKKIMYLLAFICFINHHHCQFVL